MMIKQQAFSPQEIATMLGMSLNGVYKMIRSGKLEFFRVGAGNHDIRVARSELQKKFPQILGGDNDDDTEPGSEA